MMKNKKMGILAVLVMLVAVTLNAVGGTYAKYISAYTVTDEARVARWNFNDVSTNTVDLFQSSYSKKLGEDGQYTYVVSKDSAKVVAPGTSGEYSYEVTGTAETNFKATKTVKVLNRIAIVGDYYHEKLGVGNWGSNEGDWEKSKIYYNPIQFRFTDAEGNQSEWKTATKFEYDPVSNKFLGLSLEFDVTDEETIYPANYNITDELKGKIEWRWQFQTGDTANEKFDNDALDTNLARLVDAADLTMQATVGVVVEQTDKAATVEASGVNVAAKRYLVFGNKVPDSYAVAAQKEVGYNPVNNEEVIFTGKAMTGKIYKTNNAVANRFQTPNNTGYYYPLMFTAYAEEGTDITNINIKSVKHDINTTENGYGIIFTLVEEDKENGIVVTVTYSDNTTKTFNLDLSNLTFDANANQTYNTQAN